MKFCFITYRFRSNNIGGGELYLEKLSAELINQGHDVYIISPDCKDISNISCFSSVSSIENLEEARNQKLHVMKFKNSPINDLMEKESIIEKSKFDSVKNHLLGSELFYLGYGFTNPEQQKKHIVFPARNNFCFHMPSNFSLKLKILNLTSTKNLNYWYDTKPETQIIKLSPEKNEIIIKNKGEARFFYFTEETSTYSYGFNHHLKFYDFQNHSEEEIYPKSYQAFYPIKSARSNWNKSGLTHLNVREPHSKDLLKWIKKNALFFDHLIIHGCTFKINHAVANMFQENKISYSVIPHFHQDDKFYFDAGIYKLFSGAQNVFIPSIADISVLEENKIAHCPINGGGIYYHPYNMLQEKYSKVSSLSDELPQNFCLYVGRIEEGKHIKEIIREFENCDLKLSLVIVSKENLAHFKNRNNIITLENLDEAQLAAVYLKASCLIQMGESESFGLTIIEALHFGIPCIVNQNTTTSTKLIKDGVNGYHLKKNEDIIKTVLSIINKRQSLEAPELLNNSVKKYDWSICANQFLNQFVKNEQNIH